MSIKKLSLLIFAGLVSYIAKAQDIPEGIYVIRSSINPQYVIDLRGSITSDGNNINIWKYNGTNAQKWKVVHDRGAIVIKSTIDNRCVIDLNSSNAKSGENIHIWKYNGTNAQRWYAKRINGCYELHSAVNNNFVIDLNASRTTDGNNIQAWETNGTSAQKWVFERIDDNANQSVSSSNSYSPQDFTPYNNSGNYSNSSSGTTQQHQRIKHTCRRCNGSGSCSTCHGSGHVMGFGNKYQTSCSSCYGRGRCASCGGTGYHETSGY